MNRLPEKPDFRFYFQEKCAYPDSRERESFDIASIYVQSFSSNGYGEERRYRQPSQ